MKKRILFVIDSLGLGGAEKSLINLLHCLDYSRYEVHLFLFHKKGIFLELLPQEVKVLEHAREWECFRLPAFKSLVNLIKLRRLDLVYHRIKLFLASNLLKNSQPLQQRLWHHFAPAISTLESQYDAAIGYLEKYPNYFVVEKVKAKKKIGWIHIDYKTYGLDSQFDDKYFKQLNHIVGVSPSCINTLKQCFSHMNNKFVVMENISSQKLIFDMADQDVELGRDTINIVTAARLVQQKGIDLSIEAAELLSNNGYNFKWTILGDGPLRNRLQEMIKSKGLEHNVILKGAVANPYPYIKRGDIYVQTSRFEGKSISIDEAKILGKPIVATRFPTVYDQIDDNYNGILADLNSWSIYEKICLLIDNPDIQNQLKENLKIETAQNQNYIEKFYGLIG